MRHSVFGRKLSRTKNERRRLFQGLVRDVLLHGKIRTTIAKAKAAQPIVEKLITQAKDGSRASLGQIEKLLADKRTEAILIADAKTRFANRTSGFTRIIRIGKRLGDATEEAFLQFVDEKVVAEVVAPKAKKTEQKVEAVKVEAVKPTKKKTVKKEVK